MKTPSSLYSVPLHGCPPGLPKERGGFKGGRKKTVIHPSFSLCAFCASSSLWSAGVGAPPLQPCSPGAQTHRAL